MSSKSTKNTTVSATAADLIEVRKGKAMVSSLKISELFDRRHDSVLRNIRKLGLRKLEESYVNAQNKQQPVYWLEEREALIVMPFLGGKKSLEGQTKLVDAYQALHREVAKRKEPEWKFIRDETKVGFKWMNETLKERRESAGKVTKSYHHSNEARMINAVLAGKHGKLDRDTLSASDLVLMADLQRYNAILIGQDHPYQVRKAMLMDRAIKKIAA
jgi:Rha family phage regulatory protein